MAAILAAMKTHPHIHCNADGTIAYLDRPHPCAMRNSPHEPFDKKPVQIRFTGDLSFTLYGEHFDASVELTQDDAMALMSMLMFGLRNQLWTEGFKK